MTVTDHYRLIKGFPNVSKRNQNGELVETLEKGRSLESNQPFPFDDDGSCQAQHEMIDV